MRYRVGAVEVHVLRDGVYRADGGVAFGIIPRPLWSQQAPPDRRGRVPFGVNCFLIRTKRYAVVVDTGIGAKLGAKARDIYGVRADGRLLEELEAAGVKPEAVDAVVFTHLHWDHTGGATRRDENGALHLNFPRAVHYVQQRDWDEALAPNERTRGGFRPEDLLPLREEGRLRLLEGDSYLNKNVSVIVTGGHTTAHQLVRIASRGEVAYITGDVLPARFYLPATYATAYDLFPLTTAEAKQALLRRAERRGALLLLSHDAEYPAGRVTRDDRGRYAFTPAAADAPSPA